MKENIYFPKKKKPTLITLCNYKIFIRYIGNSNTYPSSESIDINYDQLVNQAIKVFLETTLVSTFAN